MDFNSLSPEDQQAIIQRVQRARQEAPQLMREGRYAEAFDLVYYAALIDPESMEIAVRIAHQVAGIHLLRPDQIDVLREHAKEGRPLAQYLYGFWLWFNRERLYDIQEVINLMKGASDWGIGDASYVLAHIYECGEAGEVDEDLQQFYRKRAGEQQLGFKQFISSIRNHIYGNEGEEERPDLTITVLRDFIGLSKDTDLRWQVEREKELETEAALNAHPRVWHLLYLAYDAMNLRWAGELYAEMGIKQGDYDAYLDLVICRCTDPKDSEGHILEDKWDEYMRIMREGAEAGCTEMMHRLGMNLTFEYDNEDTTDERREELVPQIHHWLELASKLGHGGATESIGFQYLDGSYGYEVDYDKAWYYIHRAAMQGQVSAYYSLYIMASNAQDESLTDEERDFILKPGMDDLPAEEWERIGRYLCKAQGETWPGDKEE